MVLSLQCLDIDPSLDKAPFGCLDGRLVKAFAVLEDNRFRCEFGRVQSHEHVEPLRRARRCYQVNYHLMDTDSAYFLAGARKSDSLAAFLTQHFLRRMDRGSKMML
ncbi:MAG: hypothetical protein ACFBWO_09250 [Paracoccaceae bacterium]